MDKCIVYQDVNTRLWLFKPPSFSGEKFSHDYPTKAAAEEGARLWSERVNNINF